MVAEHSRWCAGGVLVCCSFAAIIPVLWRCYAGVIPGCWWWNGGRTLQVLCWLAAVVLLCCCDTRLLVVCRSYAGVIPGRWRCAGMVATASGGVVEPSGWCAGVIPGRWRWNGGRALQVVCRWCAGVLFFCCYYTGVMAVLCRCYTRSLAVCRYGSNCIRWGGRTLRVLWWCYGGVIPGRWWCAVMVATASGGAVEHSGCYAAVMVVLYQVAGGVPVLWRCYAVVIPGRWRCAVLMLLLYWCYGAVMPVLYRLAGGVLFLCCCYTRSLVVC